MQNMNIYRAEIGYSFDDYYVTIHVVADSQEKAFSAIVEYSKETGGLCKNFCLINGATLVVE